MRGDADFYDAIEPRLRSEVAAGQAGAVRHERRPQRTILRIAAPRPGRRETKTGMRDPAMRP